MRVAPEIVLTSEERAELTKLVRSRLTTVRLVTAIDKYIDHHNINPKPFIWTKSARDILQKVIRANSRLSSKQNASLH